MDEEELGRVCKRHDDACIRVCKRGTVQVKEGVWG